MKIFRTELPDVLILEPKVIQDSRGYFYEAFRLEEFRKASGLAHVEFVQENRSLSKKNVLRGLHYQVVKPQGKLVSVTRGKIFDVAVDLRRGSPTFRQWVGVELSGENKMQIYVPEGFGHGFLVVSDEAEVIYKTTEYFHAQYDRSLQWNDPEIGITWPLDGSPELSDKDKKAAPLSVAEIFDQGFEQPRATL